MRTIQAEEALRDWHKLATETRGQPIRLVDAREGTVVVMSEAEYQRLKGQAWDRLYASMDRLASEARASGLTEEALDALLADES